MKRRTGHRAGWLFALALLAPVGGDALAHSDAHGNQGETQGDDSPIEAPEGAKEDEWDVASADLGPTQTLKYTVSEATWVSVDISPDGQWLVFDTLGDLYRAPIGGGQAQLIRGGRAFEVQPRFSPDGQWLSFTSDASGGDNLWICKPDGSDARAVTSEDYRLLNNGVWHPNGRYLVGRKHFTSRRSAGAGELWLYDAFHGGGGVSLVPRPTDQKDLGEPAFSPDGRYLYYSLDVTPGQTFEYNKDPNGTIYAIRRLDLETGETVTLSGGNGGSVRPQLSPDGKQLAFVRRIRGKSVLMLLDLDSGAQRVLYPGLDRDQQETWAIFGVYPGYDFTPDGAAIVIWAQGRLQRVDVATGSATPIPLQIPIEQEVVEALRFSPDISAETFDVKAIRWPQRSPDGRHVVFSALGHLWLVGPQGGTPKRLTDLDDFEFYPSWSPDSKRIVFTTWDDRRGGHVRSVNLKGRRLTTHTRRPGHYTDPSYSPDGSQLVYQRRSGNRFRGQGFATELGIYLAPASGKGVPRRLTADGANPRWSGDGQRIFLLEWTPKVKTLYSVDLMGGNRRDRVTSERAVAMSVSPDGQWLAFNELFDVYVTPLPQAPEAVAVGPKMANLPVRKLTEVAGQDMAWADDSRSLSYGLGAELFTVNIPPLFEPAEEAPQVVPEITTLGWEAARAIPETDVVFVGATVFTMAGEPIEDAAVRVKGQRIEAVGPRGEVPTDGAKIIDVSGAFLMPGFVDVHAHVGSAWDGLHPQQTWAYVANLAFGTTTVHDPSNGTTAIMTSSELVKAGAIIGPRIFSTGTVLYGAEGEFKALTNSYDDALRHLKRQKAWGTWSVKSYNQPRRNQRQQIIAAGRELGMMVMPEGGSTFFANLTHILDGHTTVEHNLPVAPLYEDVLTLFAKSGTAYTPTLNVAYGGLSGELYWYQDAEVWRHERLGRFVPRTMIDPKAVRGLRAPEGEFHHKAVAASAAQLHRRGGIVEIGSHGQMQGLGTHWEMWSFHQGGLEPMEVLEIATLGGARALGLDGQLGTVEAGKLADLIVLEKDPREDMRNTDSVKLVMVGGRLYDAATMAQLEPAARPLPPGPDFGP